jgi:hypothetical protein
MKRKQKHYATTTVSESRSRMEIDDLLQRHGVETIRWTVRPELLRIEFVWEWKGMTLPFRIDLPVEDAAERRRLLRVLVYHIKAKLVAVEDGLVELEQEFLPYLIGPSNATVGETVERELLSAAEDGVMPPLKLLGLPDGGVQ